MGQSDAVLRDRAQRIFQTLEAYYGTPAPKERRYPLSELIVTILSQNTADVNTGRAYRRLREQFPSREQVLAAPTEQVAAAVQVAGLSQIKAPRIQAILRHLLQERGSLSLDFLADLPAAEARRYLTSLYGVGPKTAACVLLFSLHKPALPVDTHVHRVARRLGLVPPKASAEKASTLLESLIPEERRGRASTFLDGYLPAVGVIGGVLLTGVVVLIGQWTQTDLHWLYLVLAAVAAALSIFWVFKMQKVYDNSLLNWRLKRRRTTATSVMDKLDF